MSSLRKSSRSTRFNGSFLIEDIPNIPNIPHSVKKPRDLVIFSLDKPMKSLVGACYYDRNYNPIQFHSPILLQLNEIIYNKQTIIGGDYLQLNGNILLFGVNVCFVFVSV